MYYSQEQLQYITERLQERIPDLLQEFGVELKQTSRMYVGKCPLHGSSDKSNAFNLYYNGQPNYKCRTQNCDSVFGKSLIGLVRGLLSVQKKDWAGKGDDTVGFVHAVNWAKNWLGIDLSGVAEDSESDREKMQFIRQTANILTPQAATSGLTREVVRGRLKMPCEYFLKRGFSEAILNKYDIGTCTTTDPKREMYGRAVVPIYDTEHKFMVGCTGRSIFPRCENCKMYHQGECNLDFNFQRSKWRNSRDLKTERTLFNFWYAKRYIQEKNVAILVESQGDVLRLEESGLPYSLGCMGCSLGSFQELLLTSSGALYVLVAMNGDKAGREASEKIREQLNRSFNVRIVELPQDKDIADLSVEQTKEIFFPLLHKLKAI